jgi:hypothetical protein
MVEREDIVDAVQMIDDPEELVADLVDAISTAFETGDFLSVEELLEGIEEMVEVRDSHELVKSWRDFYNNEEDLEDEKPPKRNT